MRVVLVGPTIEENLAVGYLAAALTAAGHQVESVSFSRDTEHRDAARRILAGRPDAVGLSLAFQSRARGFANLLGDLRAAGFGGHVTAGGQFASLAAEELLDALPGLDSVVRGEADHSLVALIDRLAASQDPGAVPGIVVRTPQGLVSGPRPHKPSDLDALPWPLRSDPTRRELGLPVAPLIASRGCRGTCRYCSISAFGRQACGPRRRERSSQDLADEMARLRFERGVRVFVFHDDDFFDGRTDRDLGRIEKLGRGLRAAGVDTDDIALSVKARPDDVHPEVFQALRAMGLVQVVLGVDNGSPAGLRALGRGLTPGDNLRAIGHLRDLDIAVGSNLLLWEPDTTLADLHQNLALMALVPGQVFNLARTEPYQGAPITRHLARQGRLTGDLLGGWDYTVADPRAQLAWEVFLAVLGQRCYPPQGLINQAFRLDWHTRLLLRFHPSRQAQRLTDQALELLKRISQANRDRLADILDLCASQPSKARIQLYYQRTSFQIRAEDAPSMEALAGLLNAMQRCAHAPARPQSRPSTSVRAAIAAAAALAIGPVGAAAGASPADRGISTARAERKADPWEKAVTLEAAVTREANCGPCGAPAHIFTTTYEVLAEAPKGYRFTRFEPAAGKLRLLAVSPNGRRAVATLEVDQVEKGTYELETFFRRVKSKQEISRVTRFNAPGPEAKTGCLSQPCPELDRHPCSDPAGPPRELQFQECPTGDLGSRGSLLFSAAGSGRTGLTDWPLDLVFFVALDGRRFKGQPVGPPVVDCTIGRVQSISPHTLTRHTNCIGVPGNPSPRHGHRVYLSLQPEDQARRMRGGRHRCTIRFKVENGAKHRTHKASLRFTITPNGELVVQWPPPPKLPKR